MSQGASGRCGLTGSSAGGRDAGVEKEGKRSVNMAEKETWDSAFMSSFTPSDQTRNTNLVALWLSWSKVWCFKIAAFQEGAFASR